MERINGEIRDREKTMRGLKKKDTTILKGMQFITTTLDHTKDLRVKHPLKLVGLN